MFREGSQIGPYTLIRTLGRGGFGEIWLAERRAKFVTTKVAVKLPLDEQIDHETIKQEATLWEQASGHPNILPIIDADEYDGQIVIVSEYAPDGSLDPSWNVNGAINCLAGIVNDKGNVLGMMPHPENHVESAMGVTDGRALFAGLAAQFGKAA